MEPALLGSAVPGGTSNVPANYVMKSSTVGTVVAATAPYVSTLSYQLAVQSVSNSVNGVNPLMIASGDPARGIVSGTAGVGSALNGYPIASGGVNLFPRVNLVTSAASTTAGSVSAFWTANVSVGATVLNQSLITAGAQPSQLSKSVYLYIPSYTFNPVFEQSYLSSPIKQIKYTDIYQYQVINVGGGGNGQFNNLITNGIANIKSVLILPFYSATNGPNNTSLPAGVPVYQSPFDVAGTGPTSPLCLLTNFNVVPAGWCCTSPMVAFTNFNVQISGQNAIYNVERYQFEHFNNQLYGQNAVNGGLTDGITSSLIDRLGFDTSYGYYYVNVERMLPVEQSVPKSVQILGTNMSSRAIDLYVFIEYGNDISIDALTGARV